MWIYFQGSKFAVFRYQAHFFGNKGTCNKSYNIHMLQSPHQIQFPEKHQIFVCIVQFKFMYLWNSSTSAGTHSDCEFIVLMATYAATMLMCIQKESDIRSIYLNAAIYSPIHSTKTSLSFRRRQYKLQSKNKNKPSDSFNSNSSGSNLSLISPSNAICIYVVFVCAFELPSKR